MEPTRGYGIDSLLPGMARTSKPGRTISAPAEVGGPGAAACAGPFGHRMAISARKSYLEVQLLEPLFRLRFLPANAREIFATRPRVVP